MPSGRVPVFFALVHRIGIFLAWRSSPVFFLLLTSEGRRMGSCPALRGVCIRTVILPGVGGLPCIFPVINRKPARCSKGAAWSPARASLFSRRRLHRRGSFVAFDGSWQPAARRAACSVATPAAGVTVLIVVEAAQIWRRSVGNKRTATAQMTNHRAAENHAPEVRAPTIVRIAVSHASDIGFPHLSRRLARPALERMAERADLLKTKQPGDA